MDIHTHKKFSTREGEEKINKKNSFQDLVRSVLEPLQDIKQE